MIVFCKNDYTEISVVIMKSKHLKKEMPMFIGI